MKNIVYTICNYLDKDIQEAFIKTVISDYKSFYNNNSKNTDFKIYTETPNIITNELEKTYNFYIENDIQSDNEKYINYLKLKKNGKDKYPKHKNALKAWNTKFYIINEFFNSSYDTMTYLDCDLILRKPKSRLVLFPNILSFKTKKQKINKVDTEHIRTSRKFLPDKQLSEYINMETFYINKKCCFGLDKIIKLEEIFSLWRTDSLFIREEVALTYLFYKNNIFNKLQRHPPEGSHIIYTPIENEIKNKGKWNSKVTYIQNKLK